MSPTSRVAIIGAGRMGQGLALALGSHGWPATLLARAEHPVAEGLVLQTDGWAERIRAAEIVLVATPDDAIAATAARLAADEAVGADQAVLHLSGLLDRNALAPLHESGAALGSFHPLQTVPDPTLAAERLAGAYTALEGDDRAVEAGKRMAETLGMSPFRLEGEGKPAYHAGAVLVANYAAALVGVAEQLAERAGVPPELVDKLYLPLLHGAATNIAALGPRAALTGPIRRGDARTIMAHLSALNADEQHLYRALGLAALRLARQAGLDEVKARYVEGLLSEEP